MKDPTLGRAKFLALKMARSALIHADIILQFEFLSAFSFIRIFQGEFFFAIFTVEIRSASLVCTGVDLSCLGKDDVRKKH